MVMVSHLSCMDFIRGDCMATMFLFSPLTFDLLTISTEFQLLHAPAEFSAERLAWRFVIYLNLLRSVRR